MEEAGLAAEALEVGSADLAAAAAVVVLVAAAPGRVGDYSLGRNRLQSNWMSRFEMASLTIARSPARRPVAIWFGFVPLRRVQTQARDHGKSMTVARINRDPFSFACSAEGSEFIGVNRRTHQSGRDQDIRNRS